MASISDALANASEVGGESTAEFYIDGDMRTIAVPSDGVVLGVAGDVDVNTVRFSLPQFYRGCDLSAFEPRVNYVNANGEASFSVGTNVKVSGGRIAFDWLVPEPATRYEGAAMVAVCMREVDGEKVVRDYNATPASVTVLHGIHPERQLGPQEQADIIAAVTAVVTAATEASATAAAESAKEAQTSATAAAESAKEAQTVVGGVTASLDGKANLFDLTLPDSGSTNKGKWVRFATVDLSGQPAYARASAVLEFTCDKGKAPLGAAYLYICNGKTAGVVADKFIMWVSLNNAAFASSLNLIREGEGTYGIWYRPVYDWEAPAVTVAACLNRQLLELGVTGGYVASPDGTWNVSTLNACASSVTADGVSALWESIKAKCDQRYQLKS